MVPALQGLENGPWSQTPRSTPNSLLGPDTHVTKRGNPGVRQCPSAGMGASSCVHVGNHRSLEGMTTASHQDGATSSSQHRMKTLDRRKANSKSHHVWSKTTKPDRPLEVGTALTLQEEEGHNQAVWDPEVPFSVSAVIKWISVSGQFAKLHFTFCSLLCMHVILHLKKILQIETKTLQGGEPQKDSNSVCPLVPAYPAPPDPAGGRGVGHPGSRNSLVGWDCVIRIICPAVDPVIFFLCFLQCPILCCC